jgi:hypothetical protein
MKNKTNLTIILIFCLFTISNADIGIGISDVGTISSITSIEDENTTPVGYCLNQNYPNPFNPITTIGFDLTKTSNVTLKIFNIIGEEVAILVSDKLTAGSYNYDWNAGNLASGVYLYRLQAGDYVETRKMILMR